MTSKAPNQSMKKEEIIDYLKNTFGLNFNKEYLNKPEPDFVVELISDILDKMNVIKKEKISKMNINEMKHFQFPGIQEKSFMYLKFYKSIQKFVKNTLKIETFLSDDIFTPNPAKLKNLLSSIINYNKIITEELISTKQLKENYENSNLMIYSLNEELGKKKIYINELKDHIEKEKNAVSQLKKECEELDMRNNGLEERLKIQNEELSSLNNIINDLSKNIKDVEIMNEKIDEKIKTIKFQTIKNPEVLMNESEQQKIIIPQMQSNVEALQGTININEKKLLNLRFLEKNINNMENLKNTYFSTFEGRKNLSEKLEEIYELKLKKENEYENKIKEIDIQVLDNQKLEEDFSQNEDILQKTKEINLEQNKFLTEKYEIEIKNLSELNEILKHQAIICKKLEIQIEEKDRFMKEQYSKSMEDYDYLDNLTDMLVANMTKSLNL